MLDKTAMHTDVTLTPLQWETVFSKLSSEIDDVPIACADKASNMKDLGWDLLTPNRFKLGRSNNRALEGVMVICDNTTPSQVLLKVHNIQRYWYQLMLDRLHHLIPKPNNWNRTDAVGVGDVVLFKFKDNIAAKLESWKTGRVDAVSSDGRKLTISYPTSGGLKELTRSPRDVCLISASSDVPLNSREFFNRITAMN